MSYPINHTNVVDGPIHGTFLMQVADAQHVMDLIEVFDKADRYIVHVLISGTAKQIGAV